MRCHHLQIATLCAAAVALSACGGGGGTSSVAAIPPPPPPPPPPVPAKITCPPDCRAVPLLPSITQSTSFTTLGYARHSGSGQPLVDSGFAVSYDASTGFYTMTLPDIGATRVAEDDFGGIKLVDNVPTLRGTYMPTSGFTTFKYTGVGYYSGADNSSFGFLAFGTATPAGAVPTTGSASYSVSLQGSIGHGDGSMAFDFAKGNLSGFFHLAASGPFDDIELGRFDFSNTVMSTSAGTFSGDLVNADLGTGWFGGLFTGPNAEELMGRFQAPVIDPNSGTKQIDYGVFAGKTTP